MTLQLYEAATNPEGPETGVIAGYMSEQEADLASLQGVSTLSLRGGSLERAQSWAQSWALRIVEEIVEDRMRGHVWPIPVRDLNRHGDFIGHKQGWAFDSLLGAMWLQMMWLMRGHARRCEWCGKLLDIDTERTLQNPGPLDGRRKPRNDRRFCPSRDGVENKCKADWNYHRGPGKSSKENRRRR